LFLFDIDVVLGTLLPVDFPGSFADHQWLFFLISYPHRPKTQCFSQCLSSLTHTLFCNCLMSSSFSAASPCPPQHQPITPHSSCGLLAPCHANVTGTCNNVPSRLYFSPHGLSMCDIPGFFLGLSLPPFVDPQPPSFPCPPTFPSFYGFDPRCTFFLPWRWHFETSARHTSRLSARNGDLFFSPCSSPPETVL